MKKKIKKKKLLTRKVKAKAKKTKPKAKKPIKSVPASKPVGMVTHFYGGLKVAIVKFKRPIKLGTRLHFQGATTDFSQTVESMQYNHQPIKVAKTKSLIGIKVTKRVREGDNITIVKT